MNFHSLQHRRRRTRIIGYSAWQDGVRSTILRAFAPILQDQHSVLCGACASSCCNISSRIASSMRCLCTVAWSCQRCTDFALLSVCSTHGVLSARRLIYKMRMLAVLLPSGAECLHEGLMLAFKLWKANFAQLCGAVKSNYTLHLYC